MATGVFLASSALNICEYFGWIDIALTDFATDTNKVTVLTVKTLDAPHIPTGSSNAFSDDFIDRLTLLIGVNEPLNSLPHRAPKPIGIMSAFVV